MVPQSREFVDIFLKDAYKEVPSAQTTEILETEKLKDKKDEKTGRKLLDYARRKRPSVKEGVRSLEL